jgi:hypothetical protein
MGESIIGQEHIIERLIIGLLSNGSLLVEGLRETARLTAALFGRPGSRPTGGSGSEFSRVLRRARPRLVVVRRGTRDRILPPLNPV